MQENRARRRWLAWLAPIFVISAAVMCSDKNNNVVGPAPAPNATPTPGGKPNPTPTPVPGGNTNATVNVGQSGGMTFMDQQSGSSTTTIRAGGSVNWVWVSGTHSTTSGTCSGGCTPDGAWDSGIGTGMSFSHTFPSPGTFHYFCQVHGSLMQGTVVVQ